MRSSDEDEINWNKNKEVWKVEERRDKIINLQYINEPWTFTIDKVNIDGSWNFTMDN